MSAATVVVNTVTRPRLNVELPDDPAIAHVEDRVRDEAAAVVEGARERARQALLGEHGVLDRRSSPPGADREHVARVAFGEARLLADAARAGFDTCVVLVESPWRYSGSSLWQRAFVVCGRVGLLAHDTASKAHA
jgi:hypothetical protein